MMKSTQSFGSFSEEQSGDKNKGKEEDSCGKGGQFPTKPCINPCNFPFYDNAKVFSFDEIFLLMNRLLYLVIQMRLVEVILEMKDL